MLTETPFQDSPDSRHHTESLRQEIITAEIFSQAEAKFRPSAKQISVITYISSLNGPNSKIYISPQIGDLMGFTQSEWLADPCLWLKQIHPDDRKRVLDELAECERGGTRFISEYRLVARDGRSVWVHNEAEIVQDDSGTPLVQGVLLDISQRKQMEETLQQRERYFRALIENSLDIISIFDAEGNFVYVSPAHLRVLGYDPEEMIGSSGFDFLHPDDIPLVAEAFTRCVPVPGFTESLECRFKHKDGSWRIFEGIGKNLLDDPDVHGILINSRDITERKRSEEALKESEEKFRTLADKSPNMIYINRKGKIEYVNEKCTEILGYSQGEFYSPDFDFLSIIAPESKEKVMELYSAYLRGEERPPMEIRLITKDGKRIEIIHTRRIIRYKGDNALLGIITDITNRKKAEEALKESERRYRTLVDTSPDAIMVIDLDAHIIMANQQAAQLNGCEAPEELIGKNILDLIAPEDRERARKGLIDTIKTGNLRNAEYTMLRRDGTTFLIDVNAACMYDHEGKICGIIGVTRDISERKRLEELFRQSQKMETVGKLAGGIAHDLNNILTVITSFSSFVKDALPDGDPIREDIGEVLKASTRATVLIRQLLAFSRRQVIKPQVVNLNELILNMDKMLRRLIGEDIHLVTLPAPDLGSVRVDPGQIEQVIANLAVNARDAMPHGGTLTIETANILFDEELVRPHPGAAPGNHVMLAISDTGIGMSDEVKKHLFEPFFTTKEVGKGCGLGLATVYGIIKQHKGAIWASSEQGKGTAFKICLPRVEEAADQRPEDSEFSHLPRGNETVLVVEDEMAVRGAAVRILRGLGYTVLEAENGEDALRLAQNCISDIHLLLTDVVMPRMNGKDLADHLRAVHPPLKILFMSGYTDNSIMNTGDPLEDAPYLQKPFSEVVLAHKVREVLDHSLTSP